MEWATARKHRLKPAHPQQRERREGRFIGMGLDLQEGDYEG